MKIRLSLSKLFLSIVSLIFLIYVLARPVVTEYTHEIFKYLFMLVAALGIFFSLISHKVKKILGTKLILLLFFWIVYAVFNSFINGGVELLLLAFQNYVFLMFPVAAVPLLYKKINWCKILIFLTYFGCIDSFVSFYEFATNTVFFPIGEEIQMVRQFNGSIRTYGLNGSYFILAEVLSLCGFAAFCLYKYEKKRLYFIHFIIISLGILSTGTRGYYVAYFIGLIYLYFNDNNNKLKKDKLISIALCVFIGIILLYLILFTKIHFGIEYIDIILERIRNIFNWSSENANLDRVARWKEAINKWLKYPILGYGAGSTDIRYSKYLGVTESGFLRRLVELGIIGTILQYTTIFYPYFICLKEYRKSLNKDYFILFFSAFIISAFVEDMILQMYGGIEFTCLIWSGIGYMLASKFQSKFE